MILVSILWFEYKTQIKFDFSKHFVVLNCLISSVLSYKNWCSSISLLTRLELFYWVKKEQIIDYFQNILYHKSDCEDLPKCIRTVRQCSSTKRLHFFCLSKYDKNSFSLCCQIYPNIIITSDN